MDINDRLNELLGANQNKRLADDKARDERRDNPKILRHTTYQGDRKIQQLGEDIIENGVVLSNQSLAIGDVMLPLAKGNVLRRVDNTNGGALLGSAYRKAVENDRDANGNRRDLSRKGGDEDPDPSSPNDPRNKPKLPPSFPPPFGCSPPPPQCIWSSDPNVPQGFQSYGSAVVNENGLELFLYCTAGTAVPPDLGCDFLKPPTRWRCSGGTCAPDANGGYSTLVECEAALIPPVFNGGQCDGIPYTATIIYDRFIGAAPTNPVLTGRFTTVVGVIGKVVYITGLASPSDGVKIVISHTDGTVQTEVGSVSWSDNSTISIVSATLVRTDSLPDTCGNIPSSCPT
jgi:hypothetical protein